VLSIDWATPAAKVNRVMESLSLKPTLVLKMQQKFM